MNDLASEFFYDGIGHIVPGLVIIVLYWRVEAQNVFHAHSHFFSSPLLFIACVLPVAWLIGIAVNVVVYVPAAFVVWLIKWLIKKCTKSKKLHWVMKKPIGITKMLDWLKEKPIDLANDPAYGADTVLSRELRRQGYFVTSQRIMSRSLAIIFLFACFAPPQPQKLSLSLTWDFDFWNGHYSFLCFVAFVCYWILAKGFRLHRDVKNPPDFQI